MSLLLYSKNTDGLSLMVPSIVLCSTKICFILLKLAKSKKLTLTPQCNHINFPSTNSNTSYSDITRQEAQTAI